MSTLISLLAQDAPYRHVPFVTPLPIWNYWWLLAIPLCLGIAIVYKSIRAESMERVPRDALVLFVFILAVMALAAGALAALINVVG